MNELSDRQIVDWIGMETLRRVINELGPDRVITEATGAVDPIAVCQFHVELDPLLLDRPFPAESLYAECLAGAAKQLADAIRQGRITAFIRQELPKAVEFASGCWAPEGISLRVIAGYDMDRHQRRATVSMAGMAV